MKIKMRSVLIPAGTILAWKEYSTFTKLWRKLTHKPLPNNRYTVSAVDFELMGIDKFKSEAYCPIRQYNKQEIKKLRNVLNVDCEVLDWETVKTICNIVRPNTFADMTTLDDCKYYKKIDLNEESDEYIY